MTKRTLSLKRESLTELTTGQLADVVGGASGVTCPVKYCLQDISGQISCYASCGHSGCCSIESC